MAATPAADDWEQVPNPHSLKRLAEESPLLPNKGFPDPISPMADDMQQEQQQEQHVFDADVGQTGNKSAPESPCPAKHVTARGWEAPFTFYGIPVPQVRTPPLEVVVGFAFTVLMLSVFIPRNLPRKPASNWQPAQGMQQLQTVQQEQWQELRLQLASMQQQMQAMQELVQLVNAAQQQQLQQQRQQEQQQQHDTAAFTRHQQEQQEALLEQAPFDQACGVPQQPGPDSVPNQLAALQQKVTAMQQQQLLLHETSAKLEGRVVDLMARTDRVRCGGPYDWEDYRRCVWEDHQRLKTAWLGFLKRLQSLGSWARLAS